MLIKSIISNPEKLDTKLTNIFSNVDPEKELNELEKDYISRNAYYGISSNYFFEIFETSLLKNKTNILNSIFSIASPGQTRYLLLVASPHHLSKLAKPILNKIRRTFINDPNFKEGFFYYNKLKVAENLYKVPLPENL